MARLCLETAIGQLTVCAVTVTYGDRWHLLRRVLERLCAWPAVARVIIVDNGATYDLRGRTAGAFGLRVEVVGSGRNEGSARGYAIGMKAAREAVDTSADSSTRTASLVGNSSLKVVPRPGSL